MRSTLQTWSNPMKRKEYITIACSNCRRRKVRCSGEVPCQTCAERGRPCEYPTQPQQRGPKRKRPKTQTSDGESKDENVTLAQSAPAGGESALARKVASLERMITQLMPQNPPFSQYSATVHVDQEASNVFQYPASLEKNIALSSQLALLSSSRSKPTQATFQPGHVPVTLPDPTTLWDLVKYSLECTGLCYALLDPHAMQTTFRETLQLLGYSHARRELMVDAAHLSTISLLMNVLAMGQAYTAGSDDNTRPGWCYYSQGCLLAHRLAYSGKVDLQLVQFHLLSVIYLILVELLRSSSQAVVSAYQFASLMKLNNQNGWPSDLSPKERLERKRLWWILYHLDRRVAQKCGLPYHIRDNDFAVDDFRGPVNQSSTSASSNTIDEFSEAWLQALIDASRLWGMIWHNFFAVSATKLSDWEEIEVMDTRAVSILRRLPPHLRWNSDTLLQDAANGVSDTSLFRRLMIFTNVSLVRALIRHSPLHPPATTTLESTRLSAEVALEVMNAHLVFFSAFSFSRLVGYFSIVALVECVYHLVPALDEPSCESLHESIRSSLQTAHDVVRRVAEKHNVARHALAALDRMEPSWNEKSSATNTKKAEQRKDVAPPERTGLIGRYLPTSIQEPSADAMSSLFADIPYLAMSATELNRTMDAGWPTSDDEWQALFATHSIP